MDDPITPPDCDLADPASLLSGETQGRQPLQFSLAFLLTIVAGVAVIAAGSSVGMTGMALGISAAGVGWTAMARRAGAHRVAYYTLAATEGGLLSLVIPLLEVFGAREVGGAIAVVAFCLAGVCTAHVLRSEVLDPRKCSPWRPVLFAPYLFVGFLWSVVFVVQVVIGACAGSLFRSLTANVIPVPFVAIVVTILMPFLVLVSLLFCVLLWMAGAPGEGSAKHVDPTWVALKEDGP